jgi:phosphatidylserine/phosphatidylglycerophosphate/cardiolipin synthase-like enzyme
MAAQKRMYFVSLCLALLFSPQALAGGYGTPNPKHLPAFALQDYAEINTGSSPDNSFALVTSLIQSASRDIRMSAYMLRSVGVGQALAAAAKRGVRVSVLLDGWTVAKPRLQKIEPLELYLAKIIVDAGGKVVYLRSDTGPRTDRRFRYLHSKYIVVDENVFISSENFANSGFSPTTTLGSRGWVISIKNRALAKHYADIFEYDSKPSPGFNDLMPYGRHPDYTLLDPKFIPEHPGGSGEYRPNRGTHARGEMRIERVMAPDDTLAPKRAILGAIRSAKESIEIQTLAFAAHWGKNEDTPATAPSPLAEEVLAAARRGVKVRVMLNPPFFRSAKPAPVEQNGPEQEEEESENTSFLWQDVAASFEDLVVHSLPFLNAATVAKPRKIDTRDNTSLIKYFRETAHKERLDIQAHFFWINDNSLRILHNKGMVIDRSKTLISSINWSENSMKNNREAAVIVESPQVARFYADLFELDWKYFRNSR